MEIGLLNFHDPGQRALPRSTHNDRTRLRSWPRTETSCCHTEPRIPAEVEFTTKPALAKTMIACAVDAGAPARWVAADEVYAADPGLRTDLEACQVSYVLAIGYDRRVPTAAGPMRPDTLATSLPKGAGSGFGWSGAKGQRYYAWM